MRIKERLEYTIKMSEEELDIMRYAIIKYKQSMVMTKHLSDIASEMLDEIAKYI